MKKIYALFVLSGLAVLWTPSRAQENTDAGESGKFWWGYCGTDVLSPNEVFGLGTTSAEHYDVAVRLDPSVDDEVAGATIHGVRFMLSQPSILSGVQVWVSDALPATPADASMFYRNVPAANQKPLEEGYTEYLFDEPFTVNAPLYIGYSFTVTDASGEAGKYPVATYGKSGKPDAFYFRTSTAQPQWTDFASESYGVLVLQFLVSNDNLPKNAARLNSAEETVTRIGGTGFTMPVRLTNRGLDPISSISYVWETGGVESEEITHTFPAPLEGIGKTTTLHLPIEAGSEARLDMLTFHLRNVNGVSNELGESSTQGARITIAESMKRRTLVEEFTGTWCGWCPRGMVALDWLHENRPDDAVLVAVHQGIGYSADPMEIKVPGLTYGDILQRVDGFPSALLNRYLTTDPYHGTDEEAPLFGNIAIQNDIDRENALLAEAGIACLPTWNADSTAFKAPTEVRFLYNRSDAPYALAYVLVHDGLKGKTSTWNQINYYANYADYADYFAGTPLADLPAAGTPMKNLMYNHVAVAAWDVADGIDGSISAPITEGQTQTFAFDQTLPGRILLQDKSKLSLVVMLINRGTGRVVNAISVPILSEEDATGIHAVSGQSALGTQAVYDLQGRRQTAASRGLNIVRLPDGRVRKIMVR